MDRIVPLLVFGLGAAIIFLLGFFFEYLNLRFGLMILLFTLALGFFAVPDRVAIFLLFIYLSIEGFAKIMTGYNPIVHVGSDILIVIMVLKVLVRMVLGRATLPERFPPFTQIIFLHFSWFLIAFANPYTIGLVASLAGAKLYVTTVLLYFFGFYLTNSGRDLRFFMLPWLIGLFLQTATGLYQAFIGPVSVTSLHPMYGVLLSKYGQNAFRPFGLGNVPGMPAVFIMLTVNVFLYFLVRGRNLFQKLFLTLWIPAQIGLLFFCQIRQAILKTIIGAFIFFILISIIGEGGRVRLRPKNIFVALAVFGGIILGFGSLQSYFVGVSAEGSGAFERSMTLFDLERAQTARSSPWGKFVDIVEKVPFGAGLSRTGAAGQKFYKEGETTEFLFTDNLFVTLVIDLGVPGFFILLILYLGIWAKLFTHLWRLWSEEYRLLTTVFVASFTASFIGWYGAEGFIYNPEASFFWFFSGAALKLFEIDTKPVPHPTVSMTQAGDVV